MIKQIENLPESVSLIPLTRGTFAIVDTNNLRMLNLYRWSMAQSYGCKRYARRHVKGKTIYMHREIMNAPDGMGVDHINGNGLDNRMENLRLCTIAQNRMNSVKIIAKSSGFKGVEWHKSHHKWRARITVADKEIHIGYFDTELEAAEAYDKKALELFGEFAKPNFKDANNGTKPPISDNPAIFGD